MSTVFYRTSPEETASITRFCNNMRCASAPGAAGCYAIPGAAGSATSMTGTSNPLRSRDACPEPAEGPCLRVRSLVAI